MAQTFLLVVVTHPKHLLHVSKPSYCVSYLANATKIKSVFVIVWATLVKMFRCFFTMEIFVICKCIFFLCYRQISFCYMQFYMHKFCLCIHISTVGKYVLGKINTVVHSKEINIFIYAVHFIFLFHYCLFNTVAYIFFPKNVQNIKKIMENFPPLCNPNGKPLANRHYNHSMSDIYGIYTLVW